MTQRNGRRRFLCAIVVATILSACGTRGPINAPQKTSAAAQTGGKYYLDDGPPNEPPENFENIADAVPRPEPLHRYANRPYVVLGKEYVPLTSLQAFRETGRASWYGRKYHGQKTAIGEIFDLYAMTAAHPTAPLPSYARVTNVENGRSAVVRINDRGPFLQGRIIDLSYVAAAKLGFARKGFAAVEVELIAMGGATSPTPTTLIAPVISTPSETGDTLSGERGSEHYIQLGAFSNQANAAIFLNKVSPAVSQILGKTPHVFEQGGLHRIRVGPFSLQNDASDALTLLSAQTGIRGLIGK